MPKSIAESRNESGNIIFAILFAASRFVEISIKFDGKSVFTLVFISGSPSSSPRQIISASTAFAIFSTVYLSPDESETKMKLSIILLIIRILPNCDINSANVPATISSTPLSIERLSLAAIIIVCAIISTETTAIGKSLFIRRLRLNP